MIKKVLLVLFLVAGNAYAQSSLSVNLGATYANGSMISELLPPQNGFVTITHTFLDSNGQTTILTLIPGKTYGFWVTKQDGTSALYGRVTVSGAQQDITSALIAIGGAGGGITWLTVATLPVSPALNTTDGVTDGSGYSCTVGGGSTKVLCRWNGASWDVINAGSGAAPAFSAITAGTNTAALLIGAGGSLGTSSGGTIAATSAPFSGLTGSALCAQLPALTGDATTSAGSCNTTVGKINGTAFSGLATGLVKNTTGTGVPSIAVVGDLPGAGATTVNGQTCTLGAACNVNSGAAANSVAINNGNGAAQTGVIGTITGSIMSANNGAAPSFKIPGVFGADVNSALYTVQCDSATATIDRATTLRFITTAPTVTMPDPTASGCGNNFFVAMIASGVTATVNRTTTAVFNIYNGSTVTTGVTTFNLTTGQYATLTSPDNTNWLVRIVSGGGISSAHGISLALGCTAASASGTAYTCTTSPTFTPVDGDAILFEADVANTGAATLNVNASSAAPIQKQTGTALVANDIKAGADMLLIYDGTNWQLQIGNAAATFSTSVATGVAPTVTPGTAGGRADTEGTAPTGSANTDITYANAANHCEAVNNNNVDKGCIVTFGPVVCTNGELTLSAGFGTTATVTAVGGIGLTCKWTITSSGTGQAANPTITDTFVAANQLPQSTILCDMRMSGGTGTTTLIDQTTVSATAPVFTFGGTPVAASTYIIVRRCGP